MRKNSLSALTVSNPTEKPELPEQSLLYVGLTEADAKLTPVNGLNPPVVLSDVYPGFFASSASTTGKWGIVQVDIDALVPDLLAPFHGYIERSKRRKRGVSKDQIEERRMKFLSEIDRYRKYWRESLSECGVVLYTGRVMPIGVMKVTIYDANGRTANSYITKQSVEANPWEYAKHKDNYSNNLGLTRWLTCGAVNGCDFTKDERLATKLDDQLYNRLGLDLYYRRNDADLASWWRR